MTDFEDGDFDDALFVNVTAPTAEATAKAIVSAMLRDRDPAHEALAIIRAVTSKFVPTWITESMSEDEYQAELRRRLIAVGQVMLALAQVSASIVESIRAGWTCPRCGQVAGVTINNLDEQLAYNEDLVERDEAAP